MNATVDSLCSKSLSERYFTTVMAMGKSQLDLERNLELNGAQKDRGGCANGVPLGDIIFIFLFVPHCLYVLHRLRTVPVVQAAPDTKKDHPSPPQKPPQRPPKRVRPRRIRPRR